MPTTAPTPSATAVIAGTASPATVPASPTPAPASPTLALAEGDGNTPELLFSVPVGADGVTYQGCGVPDAGCWGPSALAVAPDGSVWIGDTQGSRLLHYSATGALLNRIDLAGVGVGADDLEVTESHLLVLDPASMPPAVLRLTPQGELSARYELPEGLRLEDGLSGIALGDLGEVLVEQHGGATISRLVDANGRLAPAPMPGYLYRGRAYTFRGASEADPTRGQIVAGGIPIEVAVPNRLGGVRLLGFSPHNSFYVTVDELVTGDRGELRVDTVVHHYSTDGRLLGMARFPLGEQTTPVAHPLAVGPDGAVYALITRPEHVEVQRLRFAQELSPILEPQKMEPPEREFTTYTHPDGRWSLRYPADLLQVEVLGNGVVIFISRDRGTVAAVDTYMATGNEYGNTGEGLRNRARETLARIYGKAVNPIGIFGSPADPWETGITFETEGGSRGEALYEQRGRDQGDFRVTGFLYGYKHSMDTEKTVLPLLWAMRDSFTRNSAPATTPAP